MKQNIANILTFIAIMIAAITLYTQNIQHKPIIEIQTISEEKLTNLPSVKGLNATYQYNGENISSLWKLHYFISNIGDEIIIGEGAKKNIITDTINFELSSKFEILEINNSESVFSIESSRNKINLSFLQWRPHEGFNLILYVEQLEDGEAPSLTINEREIINGDVQFSKFRGSPASTTIYKRLPTTLQVMLYWTAIIFYGFFFIIMPIAWISELIKTIKYKTWKKLHFTDYEQYINHLIEIKTLNDFTLPKYLPSNLWNSFDGPRPQAPNNEIGSFTFGIILLMSLSSIPLLLLIKI